MSNVIYLRFLIDLLVVWSWSKEKPDWYLQTAPECEHAVGKNRNGASKTYIISTSYLKNNSMSYASRKNDYPVMGSRIR